MQKSVVTLLCLVLTSYAFAQTSNATLGGTVSDATGALIPGVSLTATNTGTGIVTTVVTNEAGAYQFASLQTGTYTVTAELPGFQTQSRSGVALGVSQQVRLNFILQVGGVAQTVDVSVAADTLIATSSSSVGSVLPEYKVRDLPLGGRNVMALLGTTVGTGPTEDNFQGNFGGGRLNAVNVTRDGFNVTDGRYNYGALTSTYTSPDLVEEIRIITAPVDAEYGRGSGQVQMVTRSGTNQFRGSAFWTNRNSALDASKWFNNFNGVPKDYENRNQFGARLGGPIIKNKTFFFVLVDEQRYIFRQTFVGSVLTQQARRGDFRFFPDADNQNVTQLNPTVDRNGNPVRPPRATGDLQTISVFNRDPFRPSIDPTGFIQNTLLARMPSPNDYTIGDGLNTAGIRFTRRVDGYDLAGSNGLDTNRDQFNARIDHSFSANHKLSVVYTWERGRNMSTQAGITNWPGGYNGSNTKDPRLLTVSFVSTVSPTVVNEFRAGKKTDIKASWAPFYLGREKGGQQDETLETGERGKEAFGLLPKYNNIPVQVITTLFPSNVIDWAAGSGSTRSANSPLYMYGDTLSWTTGKHAFKVGGEFRRGYSNAGGDRGFTPQVRLGAGGVQVQNLDNQSIQGLTGNNQTLARNLLTDLAGSVASVSQAFDLRNPKDLVFRGYSDGVKLQKRDWHENDFSAFVKDSWKIRPDVTMNFGVAYYFFGVPYEGHGLAGGLVGGGDAGLCGISCGALTTVQFVGKHSPNPDKQMWDDDWNNFAPSIGVSWSLPWFGKDKTVLRAGYGWTYNGNGLIPVNGNTERIGIPPGVFEGSGTGGVSYTQAAYLSLANVRVPIPQQFAPLEAVPLDGARADAVAAAVAHRVAPYTQNFNVELQRELSRNLTASIAYVGTKSTKLWNGVPLNAVKIFENGFLDAFNTTRAGGDAKLFDDMLRGLNLGSNVINGTTVTGSASLRANTNTRAFLANGNVGQLADFLNRSTNVTGKGGGFVRNSGLFPENFFVLNPEFNTATLHGNLSNSTYHSIQVSLTKRLSRGFTSQGAYTWSRTLGADIVNGGEDEVLNSRDPRNRALDKSLVNYHRTHNFTGNGTYELPFGPGRMLLGNAPGFLRLCGALHNRRHAECVVMQSLCVPKPQ